jgi:hypothetical protein
VTVLIVPELDIDAVLLRDLATLTMVDIAGLSASLFAGVRPTTPETLARMYELARTSTTTSVNDNSFEELILATFVSTMLGVFTEEPIKSKLMGSFAQMKFSGDLDIVRRLIAKPCTTTACFVAELLQSEQNAGRSTEIGQYNLHVDDKDLIAIEAGPSYRLAVIRRGQYGTRYDLDPFQLVCDNAPLLGNWTSPAWDWVKDDSLGLPFESIFVESAY